jgi:hypothetical protein
MVLSCINLLRVEIDCSQTHVKVLSQRQPDLATTVFGAVEFPVGDPAFFQSLLDVFAEVLVVGVVWTVVPVKPFLEGMTWGATTLLAK